MTLINIILFSTIVVGIPISFFVGLLCGNPSKESNHIHIGFYYDIEGYGKCYINAVDSVQCSFDVAGGIVGGIGWKNIKLRDLATLSVKRITKEEYDAEVIAIKMRKDLDAKMSAALDKELGVGQKETYSERFAREEAAAKAGKVRASSKKAQQF